MSFGISGDEITQAILRRYPVIDDLVNRVHGSGIDYDWFALETKRFVRLTNTFHAMNETGMYVATCDFTIIIPKTDMMAFKVQCSSGRYWWNRNMLGDYITDLVSNTLHEIVRAREKEFPVVRGFRVNAVFELFPATKTREEREEIRLMQEAEEDGAFGHDGMGKEYPVSPEAAAREAKSCEEDFKRHCIE